MKTLLCLFLGDFMISKPHSLQTALSFLEHWCDKKCYMYFFLSHLPMAIRTIPTMVLTSAAILFSIIDKSGKIVSNPGKL